MKLKLESSSFGKILVAATALLATQTSAWAAKKCQFSFSWKGTSGSAAQFGSMLGACPASDPASSLTCSCGFEVAQAGQYKGVSAYTDCQGLGSATRTNHAFNLGDYEIQQNGSAACILVDAP